MKSIIIISRPIDQSEYMEFKKGTALFSEISSPFRHLHCFNENFELLVLHRGEDTPSLKEIQPIHAKFIKNKILSVEEAILLVHDHVPNIELIKQIGQCNHILYSSQEHLFCIKPIKADTRSNLPFKIKISDREICSCDDIESLYYFLSDKCNNKNNLEVALKFLHKCLVTVPPLPENIDKDYQGKENEGSIGVLYDKWKGSSPDKKEETLSVLRDVVLEWAEK